MNHKTGEVEVAEALGQTFGKGNIPEINPIRCLRCTHCAVLCKKVGPDVLEIVDGTARVVPPENGIGGACMIIYPTRAIFLMSKHVHHPRQALYSVCTESPDKKVELPAHENVYPG